MEYTKKQLRSMFKNYLTKVLEATPWRQAEEDELDEYANSCGYAFAKNYTWGGTLQPVDVLFVLSGDAKNYQAFIVLDEKLEDLHQDHRIPYCLTCLNKESKQAEQSIVNKYF